MSGRLTSSAERKPFALDVNDRIRASAAKVLPFRLTAGQRDALKEIVEDMCRPTAMHRLLQGDVGAGKTIVALLAAVVVMENGLQVAFIVDTREVQMSQQYIALLGRQRGLKFESFDSEPAATLRTTTSIGTISTWRTSCSRMLRRRMK